MSEDDHHGLDALHVLGGYWRSGERRRTALGTLVHAARDLQQAAAAEQLADRIVALAPAVAESAAAPVVVVAVPSNPTPAVHLPRVLAEALVRAGLGDWGEGLLRRQTPTRSLRDADPAERLELARAAGYTVGPIGPGTTVVLVDDVILTGTTISHVAGCLRAAGAARVMGVVAARSRRG